MLSFPTQRAHTSTHTFHTTSHLPPSDQRESVTRVSASPSQRKQPPNGSLLSTFPLRPAGWVGVFPECSLLFLIGHHSLVMFTLMSYMFIRHGPSLTWMGLWGDILCCLLPDKGQVISRNDRAPFPAWWAAAASSSPPVSACTEWALPAAVPQFRRLTLAEPFHESSVRQCVCSGGPCDCELMQAFIFNGT